MSDETERAEQSKREFILTKGEMVEGRGRFPEVIGLCRTCSHALIRRRQHSEMPSILCEASWNDPHTVPPDIMECSKYNRKGEMSLFQMEGMAQLIDKRKKGGQYL